MQTVSIASLMSSRAVASSVASASSVPSDRAAATIVSRSVPARRAVHAVVATAAISASVRPVPTSATRSRTTETNSAVPPPPALDAAVADGDASADEAGVVDVADVEAAADADAVVDDGTAAVPTELTGVLVPEHAARARTAAHVTRGSRRLTGRSVTSLS